MSATASTPPGTSFRLTPAQVGHFRTFGFLRLPGLFADEIDRISGGFDEVFAGDHDVLHTYEDLHDGQERQIIVGFVEKSDDLRWLLDDPRITGVVSSIMESDGWEYCGSDGNVMSCETAWHCDIFNSPLERLHVKLFFYLDAVDRHSGALRFIPGTNHWESDFATGLRAGLSSAQSIRDRYGVEPEEVPSFTVPSEPGDLLVGMFRTLHATFHGPAQRRLFTLNFRELLEGQQPSADQEFAAAFSQYAAGASAPS